MYIQQLGEIFPPPRQITVGVCNQITLLLLYCISSSLLTLLKVTDAIIEVPNIFDSPVISSILAFRYTFFVPEMSASFTSYVV